MHISELVFSSGGFIFIFYFFCCCTIGGIPPRPRAMRKTEFLPILVGEGEFLRDEYVIRYHDAEHHICDRVVGLFGFCLGVFEIIDVVGDALTFEMVMLYLVL